MAAPARFASWTSGAPPAGYFHGVSDQAAEFYSESGFLVLLDAFSPAEVAALNREATAIVRGDRGPVMGFEGARSGESDDEVLARCLCIHYPYKLSRLMLDQAAHPSIVQALVRLLGPNVKCMQSMLFIKAAGKPGQAWHQDEDYIPTRDRSLTGAWLALDDATVENGCLWVIPGSHRRGVLWPMRDHEDHQRFDCSQESYGFPYRDEDGVPVEVPAGALVLFNGYLLHRSLPNRAASGYRRALVNHYMRAESLLPWSPPRPGELMAQADFRDVILVAGEDPYAYKGTEDLARASVRASGEGGCGKSGTDPSDR